MSRRCRALGLRVLRLPVLSSGVLRRLAPLAERVFAALDAYRDVPRMLVALVLALMFQVHRAVFLRTCAYALGIDVALTHLLIALPVISLIEMVPLTLAGLGTREAAFVLVLQNFGIAPAEAVALSLLAFFLGIVLASLPGAPSSPAASWPGSRHQSRRTRTIRTVVPAPSAGRASVSFSRRRCHT